MRSYISLAGQTLTRGGESACKSIYAYAYAKFLIKCVGVLQFYRCGFFGVHYLEHRSEATLKVMLGV